MTRHLLGAVLALCAFLLLEGIAAAATFTPGTPGTGDPFFPLAGNGGYDVARYDLELTYEPASRHLSGTAAVKARATQDLSSFDLDLRGFTVSRVLVNGRAAQFARDGQELIVTPAAALQQGAAFHVTVDYAGTPLVITDPDGSIEGWVPTDDGAYVVCEPQGAPTWYPATDDPADKATFEFAVTVPDGLTVMANGVLRSHKSRDGWTTWRWRERDPMSTYLATAVLGHFELTEYEIDGIPAYVAIDPQLPETEVPAKLPEVIRFFSSVYGPYPFTAAGAVLDRAPAVWYALETQTKPVFPDVPDEATFVHELAHMWFGDSVTLADWPDIWLNEGFGMWSEWIWSERHGGMTAHEWFRYYYAMPAINSWLWTPPPGDPERPEDLFALSVYLRGAMTLQALREKVGDETFFLALRTWAQQHRFGTVTTPQFIALAEQLSGIDLDTFFRTWLYDLRRPTVW